MLHKQPSVFRGLVLYLISFASILFACNAHADYWDADVLYNNHRTSPEIRLGINGTEVARFPTAWLIALVETRNRIQSEAGVYSKLLLDDKPVINAYASGTGQNTIAVTLKMLTMLHGDVAATAALVGHETAHLYRKHGLQTLATSSIFQILGNLAAQALEAKLQSKGIYAGVGTQVASAGTELVAASFSREQEREADDLGTRWMLKLGYEPQGALRLHEGLLAKMGDHDSFFASHPPTSERLASIEQLIAQYDQSRHATQTQALAARSESKRQPRALVTSAQEPNIPDRIAELPKGQLGVILTLKPRYNYVIFSGTTAQELPVGGVVKVVGSSGVQYVGKIARAVDGYYSATVSGDVSKLSVGDQIEGN